MSDSVPAWIPSAKFEEAVTYAIRVHGSQARKGGPIPYLPALDQNAVPALRGGTPCAIARNVEAV